MSILSLSICGLNIAELPFFMNPAPRRLHCLLRFFRRRSLSRAPLLAGRPVRRQPVPERGHQPDEPRDHEDDPDAGQQRARQKDQPDADRDGQDDAGVEQLAQPMGLHDRVNHWQALKRYAGLRRSAALVALNHQRPSNRGVRGISSREHEGWTPSPGPSRRRRTRSSPSSRWPSPTAGRPTSRRSRRRPVRGAVRGRDLGARTGLAGRRHSPTGSAVSR